jgi:hypothetical protein
VDNVGNVGNVSGYVNESGETTDPETVTWSQVRYTGCCLLVVAVTPASPGVAPSLAVTALDEYGATIDDFTLYR